MQLTARVLDASGEWLRSERVTWRVAGGDAVLLGSEGGVVALAPGTAEVIASHAVGEDTARVTVADAVRDPVTCDVVTEFGIGEVRQFAGPEAVGICLPGREEGFAEYVVTLANLGTSAASVLPVRLEARGAAGAELEASWTDPVPGARSIPEPEMNFHRRIREESSQWLEPLMPGTAARIGASLGQSGDLSIAEAAVGTTLTFNGGIGGKPCDVGETRTGVIRHVGRRSIIVEDVLNPPGGFDSEDFIEFGDFFDHEAWPLVTGVFGTPSDIDRNERVIIFFSVVVNELPENANDTGSGSFVGGFFYNRDLFDRATCAGSNQAEIFYLMVPDPVGDSRAGGRRVFSRDLVLRRTPSLLVHELQHLVNDSRRLHISRAPVWEATWLNEGLSHLAEELMFFRRSGLPTASNLTADAILGADARSVFHAFHIDNLDRLTIFLESREETSVLGPDALSTRGATWSFLRYVVDRLGPAGPRFLEALVRDSRLSGLRNFAEALGEDPLPWLADWAVALWADDTGIGEPRHSISSWNYRSIYPELGELAPGFPRMRYPLEPRLLREGEPRIVNVPGAGVNHFRIIGIGSSPTALRVTVGATDEAQLPAPGRLRVAVARVR